MEDSAAGVLVLKGVGYFVWFPAGRCDERGFLGKDFGAFTDQGTVQSGDELDVEGAGHW